MILLIIKFFRYSGQICFVVQPTVPLKYSTRHIDSGAETSLLPDVHVRCKAFSPSQAVDKRGRVRGCERSTLPLAKINRSNHSWSWTYERASPGFLCAMASLGTGQPHVVKPTTGR